MDSEGIERIEAELAAITPGPWEVRQDGWQVTTAAHCNICGTHQVHQMHDGGRSTGEYPVQPDARFIANAPTHIRRLLEALRLSEQRNREVEDALSALIYTADEMALGDDSVTRAGHVRHAAENGRRALIGAPPL